MRVDQVSKIIVIGEMAVAFAKAEIDVKMAHASYKNAIREYENEHGVLTGRLDPRNPDHQGAISFTNEKFACYRKALRMKNNIKRRLTSASRIMLFDN